MHFQRQQSTGTDGGGAVISLGTLRNALFIGNQAARWGGGLRANGGVVENCTVVGNASGAHSGGVYNRGATIYNTIAYYNYAPADSNYKREVGGSATNCCITPLPAQGAGHIADNPLFILDGAGYGTDHIAGDYQLRLRSPCVNAGLNRDWMDDARDLSGNWRRFNNSNVDIGAYELTLPLGTRFLLY